MATRPHQIAGLRIAVADDLDFHLRQTRTNEAELPGRPPGNVQQAPVPGMFAVGDAKMNAMVVAEIGHPDDGAKRQTRMNGGQFILIVALAVGGASAMEFIAVIRSNAYLRVANSGRIRFMVTSMA